MVKREKSPEVTEDIRLFAVWNPYPLNPNWVYDEDVQNCAKWVAEVIGKDYLFNIHRKPSSRGMILLEISKKFTDHGRLLGEHQWCNFLKDPTNEENGPKTGVYYSIYRTCREASKDGWRPRTIETKWFKDWSPGTGRFVFPYPESAYCPLPPEDKTDKQICRHIPQGPKPPKTNGPESVVGSPAWVVQQKEEVSNSAGPATSWRSQNETKSPTTANVVALGPSQTSLGSVLPPQNPEPPTITQQKSKAKAMSLQQFRSQTEVPQKRVPAPAWVGYSQPSPSAPTGQKPLDVQQPSAKPLSAWSIPLKIVPTKSAKFSIKPDSADHWQSSCNSWSATPDEAISSQATQHLSPGPQDFNMKPLVNSLDEAESEPSPSHLASRHSDDESDMGDILAPMGTFIIDNASTDTKEGVSRGPSDDKDWGQEWSNTEEDSKKKPNILCPTHGLACSKKICLDYKRLEREQKREEANKSGELRGRGRGRGRGRSRRPFRGGYASRGA